MDKEFDLFNGLTSLSHSSFPKRCSSCERVFETVEQYIAETENLSTDKSGLKQSYDDDDSIIVELYRNCPCGSTLMDFFTDRRDLSEAGIKRRKKFQEVMDYLISQGVDKGTARQEVLKVVHGQQSELINSLRDKKK